MPKVVALRLDDNAYRELREAAEAERRSLSNLIVWAALAKIREQKFVADPETTENLSDERLSKKLRSGSRDARERKGRFVD